MDDYIAFYLVVGGNGSKYSKYIRIKITEEITNNVIRAAGYSRPEGLMMRISEFR